MLDYIISIPVPVPDEEVEELVAGLKEDGIVVTREEARRAIIDLAELYLLICRPLPLPAPKDSTLLEG